MDKINEQTIEDITCQINDLEMTIRHFEIDSPTRKLLVQNLIALYYEKHCRFPHGKDYFARKLAEYHLELGEEREAKDYFISAEEFEEALKLEKDPKRKRNLETKLLWDLVNSCLRFGSAEGNLTDDQDERNYREAERLAKEIIPLAEKYSALKLVYNRGFESGGEELQREIEDYLKRQNRDLTLEELEK